VRKTLAWLKTIVEVLVQEIIQAKLAVELRFVIVVRRVGIGGGDARSLDFDEQRVIAERELSAVAELGCGHDERFEGSRARLACEQRGGSELDRALVKLIAPAQ
jgi:hypothetical protein